MRGIATQLELYRQQNGFYPSPIQGLAALVAKPTTDPKPRNWKVLMQSVPNDPWGRPYVYRLKGPTVAEGFELKSLGPDGVESADDITP